MSSSSSSSSSTALPAAPSTTVEGRSAELKEAELVSVTWPLPAERVFPVAVVLPQVVVVAVVEVKSLGVVARLALKGGSGDVGRTELMFIEAVCVLLG